MPDYQKMYLVMAKATENAINTLIQAQQEAEEIYTSTPEPNLRFLEFPQDGTDLRPE